MDAYKAYASRPFKPQTDCQKRSVIVQRLKQLDTLITGYNRLLNLPECPGNAVLMQMTRKEKIDGIAKKELLKKTEPEKKGLNQNAEIGYSQPFTSTSSNDDTITELMDVTPDEGNEISRSSSASPIPSEAENEDEIEEEEGFAQIQMALDDP
ncbi:hypothetical protein TNCT_12841, partial [Trichonephila clavata]